LKTVHAPPPDDIVAQSEAMRTAIAEIYVGLPL
jgi:hypothetical protein